MYRTDNPLRDFDRYDEERQRRLDRMPVCCHCGYPIQDEECYELEEGKYTCPACLDEHYKVWTDDLTD